MTDKFHESSLLGGRTSAEVVRIGNTVRRIVGPNSKFSHDLLKLLEDEGFNYAPRFLGLDEQGREILTFMEGDVPHQEINWTDNQLIKIVQIIKEFHDATAGNKLAGTKEVVCHNDIAPWNTVLYNNMPVAFIDFDEATPGNRVDDIAYFLWTFLELGNNTPADRQADKIKMLGEAYGFSDGPKLVDAILAQQNKILVKRQNLVRNAIDQGIKEFSASKVTQIHSEIEWTKINRKVLEDIF